MREMDPTRNTEAVNKQINMDVHGNLLSINKELLVR